MKLLTTFTIVVGLMLIAISASAADDDYDDGDDDDYYVELPDPNPENFENLVADAEAENLPSANEPENEQKQFDERQYIDDDDDDNDVYNDNEDKKELVKKWTYKCEPSECNARCKKLLLLETGMCGYNGKCFCRRDNLKKKTF